MNQFNNVVEELEWRGALADATPGAREALISEKATCYNGFDPSSNTLHIGNLLAIMGLVRLQRHGHRPIAVVGGGTGMIGDPSGRTEERQLQAKERIEANVESIRAQLERFLDLKAKQNPAKLINNADWLMSTRLVDFLRDIGKHFSINTMLGRESVSARLARESGISFTEFSYQLLQAYDYLVLYEREGCTFQMGGTDQWGNILGGVDLIRRVHGTRPGGSLLAHALVYPLITDSKGDKLGKSIGGAPALDASVMSPYRFYQFWLNVADADVIRLLKLFTLLGPKEIAPLEEAVATEPQKREAQQTLAREVTRQVHGGGALQQAERLTHAFFAGDLSGLRASELEDLLDGAPGTEISRSSLENGGEPVAALAVTAGLCKSGGEVRRLAQQGGLYLNGERIGDPARPVTTADLIDGRLLVLRRGAKSYALVRAV